MLFQHVGHAAGQALAHGRVEMYRLLEPTLAAESFEGHARVTAGLQPEMVDMMFPAGSVRVPTDQPLGVLAMLLLEPASPDSFFQWGMFLEILQRTEYVEGYVMEPTAEKMLAADPALRTAFEAALQDEEFAASPEARLRWFYERTPWLHLQPGARRADRPPSAQGGEKSAVI